MSVTIVVGLTHGAALSVFMTALVVASLKRNPRIWQGDAPKAVQALLPPVDAATRAQKRRWATLLFVGLIAIFGHLAWTLRVPGPLGIPKEQGFTATFLAALIAFELFNLVDAVVIDLGLVFAGPRWAFPEGAYGHPAFRDPRWHLVNFLKGAAGGFPFAAIVAGIAVGLNAAAT
jgi:hypothetical protein